MILQPEVLFVTNKDDLAIDFLIYKFKDNKIPYLRINSEDIIHCSMTWDFSSGIRLSFEDFQYSFERLNSVYFRRAPSIFPDTINPNDTPFINGERRDFFEGLYMSLPAKWINPVFATYISEKKLFQLNTAKSIGFNVPNTIVSNNPCGNTKFH